MRLHLCVYATLDTASDAVYDAAALTSKDSLHQFLERCGCHLFFSGPVRVFVLGVFKGAVVHAARGGLCGLRRVAIWIC